MRRRWSSSMSLPMADISLRLTRTNSAFFALVLPHLPTSDDPSLPCSPLTASSRSTKRCPSTCARRNHCGTPCPTFSLRRIAGCSRARTGLSTRTDPLLTVRSDTAKLPVGWDQRGADVFRAVYRDRADAVQKSLRDAYPDLGPSSAAFYRPSPCPCARAGCRRTRALTVCLLLVLLADTFFLFNAYRGPFLPAGRPCMRAFAFAP